MPHEYQDLAVRHARVVLVDLGHTVLRPFSDKAHEYAAKILQRDGVELRLGISVGEVHEDRAVLSDGTTIPTRCVVWGGGSWRRRWPATRQARRAGVGGSTSNTT